MRGPRLAIESDVHLAVFPTVASCLVDLQFIPNDFYNGLEAIAGDRGYTGDLNA